MSRRLVARVVMLVIFGLVGLSGVSDSLADVGQLRGALVGRWKAAAANDPSVLEFVDESSWNLSDGTTTFVGKYVWTDGDTVKANFTQDSLAKVIVWRIQIDGGVLRTIGTSGHIDTWIRISTSLPTSTTQPERSDVAVSDVTASAPTLLRSSDLGRPVDADFRLISGSSGAPLYRSEAGDTSSAALNQDFMQVTDVRDLSANADWWGIGGNVGSIAGRRYLRYRAYQQTNILTVDDTAERLHDPPSNASWYVAAIVIGRSYETVVSGDSSRFTAGVEAKLHVFNAAVRSIAEHERLQVTIKARGIVGATDKAIFAQSADEIISAYKQSDPVPIYVVYRHIAGRSVKPSQAVAWMAADDIKVDVDPVSCACAVAPEPVQVDAVCRVRNHGPRAMEVTLGVHAVTGSAHANADQTGRVRVQPNQIADVSINAPIQTSWDYHCDSLATCACELRDMNPL